MRDDSTPDGDTFSGLGTSNDGVFLYAPGGAQISSYLYATGTRGVSFEADLFGNDLGLSSLGQNGAVQGANLDVGSPGTAVVPEPATFGALGAASFLFLRSRRS